MTHPSFTARERWPWTPAESGRLKSLGCQATLRGNFSQKCIHMEKHIVTHKRITQPPLFIVNTCTHTHKHRNFQSITQTQDIHMHIHTHTKYTDCESTHHMSTHTCLGTLASLKAQTKEPRLPVRFLASPLLCPGHGCSVGSATYKYADRDTTVCLWDLELMRGLNGRHVLEMRAAHREEPGSSCPFRS